MATINRVMAARILINICAMFIAVVMLDGVTFAQEQEPVLYGVITHQIKPDKLELHNGTMADLAALCKKHGFSYPYRAYSANNFRWFLICPIESIGDMDKVFAEMEMMSEKAGSEWASVGEREHDSLESWSLGVYMSRPDLSYAPENPRIQESEGTFIRWDVYRLKFGDEEKVFDVLRRNAALCRSKGIRDGYTVILAVMENVMPVLLIARHARSEADFIENRDLINEQLGDEHWALVKEFSRYIRSMVSISGRYVTEQSYMKSE